ncbi:MAG TPA: transketolase C-terminal domain-containing protein, partial [Anaerolineales bacterium]|nr:transketolase C-terminal domain-containing protein [Anaerolineales bacterium]
IGLGEDGPTHQPIEHLAALRAIPNLVILRPADANETTEAWKAAIARRNGPTALALTRQNVPTLDREIFAPASGLHKGAYVLADLGEDAPELILMASGSEVSIIVEAGFDLMAEGINVRLVSFPCWELFKQQDAEYQNTVLPPNIPARLAVEAGVSQGWERWVGAYGATVTLDHFGASAPYQVIYEQFGLTPQHVAEKAIELLRG